MMDKPRIIDITRITDPRGNLSVIEGERTVPFEIKRVFISMMYLPTVSAAGMPTMRLSSFLYRFRVRSMLFLTMVSKSIVSISTGLTKDC